MGPMLSFLTPCRLGICAEVSYAEGGERGSRSCNGWTHLDSLHGTILKDLLDAFVLVVGAKLALEDAIWRSVIGTLGTLSGSR